MSLSSGRKSSTASTGQAGTACSRRHCHEQPRLVAFAGRVEEGQLDDAGRLIGIDVRWRTKELAQGLLLEDGALWRLELSGRRERLEIPSPDG